MLDDRGPGSVELVRGGRRASPGDAVGLLDESDAEPRGERDAGRRREVAGAHPSPGSMTQDESRGRRSGLVQVDPRRTVRRLDLDRRRRLHLPPGYSVGWGTMRM